MNRVYLPMSVMREPYKAISLKISTKVVLNVCFSVKDKKN